MFFMWLVAQLPLRVQWWLGSGVGRLVWRLGNSRRRITETNIRLCFPQLTEQQQRELVKKSFIANGIGLLEIGVCWFCDTAKLKAITTLHGLENFERARGRKRRAVADQYLWRPRRFKTRPDPDDPGFYGRKR
ncbi:lysophospholipid acyltransferase family protein [Marinobacter gelidimuriae]|uniref:lysophospholipid acyltransferase family protein n=1 Tax=Marinobacter gelidimuriae TaxID=2739064 RepID=UPI00039BD6D6|nr:hypothetical protein [Marinobacter gelidimuriae]